MPSAFFSRLAALLLVAGGLTAAYFAYQEAVHPLLSEGSEVRMQPLEEATPDKDEPDAPQGPAVLQTPGLSEEEKNLPPPAPEEQVPATPAAPASSADGTAVAPSLEAGATLPDGATPAVPPAPAHAPVAESVPALELSVRRPDDVRVRITSQDDAPTR